MTKQWVRRAVLVAALSASLAIIVMPDWCVDLPLWLRWALGCECSSGDCSGAN